MCSDCVNCYFAFSDLRGVFNKNNKINIFHYNMFTFIIDLFSVGNPTPSKPLAVQKILPCAWCTNLSFVHAKCHLKTSSFTLFKLDYTSFKILILYLVSLTNVSGALVNIFQKKIPNSNQRQPITNNSWPHIDTYPKCVDKNQDLDTFNLYREHCFLEFIKTKRSSQSFNVIICYRRRHCIQRPNPASYASFRINLQNNCFELVISKIIESL